MLLKINCEQFKESFDLNQLTKCMTGSTDGVMKEK